MSPEEAIRRIKNHNAEIERLNGVIKNFKATKNRQKAEIERLQKSIELMKGAKCVDSYDGETLEYCTKSPCPIYKTSEQIKAEAVKEFAEKLCKDRVSNDPVVIAVKVELKTAGVDNG